MSAEQAARQTIDKLLAQAGWTVQDFKQADTHAAQGVAIREFVLNAGYGFADYLLYVDGKAAGVIEAKKAGATLTGVEIQSARYAQGLPGGAARVAAPAALRLREHRGRDPLHQWPRPRAACSERLHLRGEFDKANQFAPNIGASRIKGETPPTPALFYQSRRFGAKLKNPSTQP